MRKLAFVVAATGVVALAGAAYAANPHSETTGKPGEKGNQECNVVVGQDDQENDIVMTFKNPGKVFQYFEEPPGQLVKGDAENPPQYPNLGAAIKDNCGPS